MSRESLSFEDDQRSLGASQMTELDETLVREVVDRMRASSAVWLADRTVSILIEEFPDVLTQWGTGVLILIADELFLVSARHVLTHARDGRLWINPVANGAKMIPLTKGMDIVATTDGKADFAFIKLPPALCSELAVSKRFVRIQDVEGARPTGSWYAVLGYPKELNVFRHTEPSVPSTPMFYATRLHNVETDPPTGFDPAINLALEYPLYGSGDSLTRKLTTLPDVHGMSGSGIWRLYRYGEPALGWSEEQIKIAGVLHTRAGESGPFHLPSGGAALVGVHFIHVIRTVRAMYPELAAAIALIDPDPAT